MIRPDHERESHAQGPFEWVEKYSGMEAAEIEEVNKKKTFRYVDAPSPLFPIPIVDT